MNFAGKNGFREMHKMYSPVRRDHRRTTRFMEPYCFQGYRVLMRSRHVFLLIPPRGGGSGYGRGWGSKSPGNAEKSNNKKLTPPHPTPPGVGSFMRNSFSRGPTNISVCKQHRLRRLFHFNLQFRRHIKTTAFFCQL